MNLDFKIINPMIGDKIPLPTYATDGAAAIDLRAAIEADRTINPKEKILIPTGIAIDIKDTGKAAFILPRSGLGHKQGIILGNSTGLIDSDYQGELFVSLLNSGEDPYRIETGERIAQIVFVDINQVELNRVKDFAAVTKRGTGGFGSTGKNDVKLNELPLEVKMAESLTKEISVNRINIEKKMEQVDIRFGEISKSQENQVHRLNQEIAKIAQSVKTSNEPTDKVISLVNSLSKVEEKLKALEHGQQDSSAKISKRFEVIESKQNNDENKLLEGNIKKAITDSNTAFDKLSKSITEKIQAVESDNETLQEALQQVADENGKLKAELKTIRENFSERLKEINEKIATMSRATVEEKKPVEKTTKPSIPAKQTKNANKK